MILTPRFGLTFKRPIYSEPTEISRIRVAFSTAEQEEFSVPAKLGQEFAIEINPASGVYGEKNGTRIALSNNFIDRVLNSDAFELTAAQLAAGSEATGHLHFTPNVSIQMLHGIQQQLTDFLGSGKGFYQ